MPDPVWFRSLYWRIAIGFVAMLAVVLSLQAGLFLWLTGRFAESNRTPQQLADQVARELSDALTDNPALDLEKHVRDRYDDMTQAFAVILRDGRKAANRPGVLPPNFGERPPRRPFGDGPPRPGPGPDGERPRFEPPPGEDRLGLIVIEVSEFDLKRTRRRPPAANGERRPAVEVTPTA